MSFEKRSTFLFYVLFFCTNVFSQALLIKGRVMDQNGTPIPNASIVIRNSTKGAVCDENGKFGLHIHNQDSLSLIFRAVGFETLEQQFSIATLPSFLDVHLSSKVNEIEEVTVKGISMVKQLNNSAYNVSAVDASVLQNTNLDVAHALNNVTGVKIRETGGVGSQMQISLNGFSGKHVKIFMDGVPMDGMGTAFSLNNIPINMADRIEVYKGVVPVGLGSDALGGAINVITKQKKRTYIDMSYSYGSFNTHRSNLNVGLTSKRGLNLEVNAFQNYSDNSYYIYNPVKNLANGQINLTKIEHVKRFHDQFHSETAILKAGFVNKSFADRMLLTFNMSRNYKQLQNGVIQNVVFGQKAQRSTSYMPSFVYQKSNLLKGFNVNFTTNYNYNIRQNIDTATFEYNWKAEKHFTNKLGEQSYQNSKFGENNWNSTLGLSYCIGEMHLFSLNNVFTSFNRRVMQLSKEASTITPSDTMPKRADKNVLGLSYRFNPSKIFNVTAFVKHFYQYSIGPQQSSTSSSVYTLTSGSIDAAGYGAAGTVFLSDFQVKLSYEQTYRLPTDTELFGDQDLEHSSLELKPEDSDNYNLSVSYEHLFNKKHFVFVDAGFVYRDVKNYISRVIESASNKYFATNINHGKVANWGLNAEAHYQYMRLLSLGFNLTYQDIRDAQKYNQLGNVSETYDQRIPNQPYFFTTADVNVFVNNFIKKGNNLTLGCASNYSYEFPLYTANLGSAKSKIMVPSQLSHDASLTYTFVNGKYNFTFECRNVTDAKLYDNYSLQKPGRSFALKVRYFFSK